jgi:hypothetical protein
MVPMVLEELYLTISLMGDEKNIDDHKKKGGIGGLLEKKK